MFSEICWFQTQRKRVFGSSTRALMFLSTLAFLFPVNLYGVCQGLSCSRHEVLNLRRIQLHLAWEKNNTFCKVQLVGCIQHDKDKLVVIELLSLANEVQDQWWIPKGRRISDHAAFYRQVRPRVHLSFTNCKRLNNLKIKTYLAFSIVEVVRSVVRSLGKCANISYLILYFVFAQVPLHYTHVGWSNSTTKRSIDR